MEWTSTCHLTEFRPARASEPHTTTGKPKAHTSSERKSFPRYVHPPHDAYLPRDVPMGCKRFRHAKANLYGQVEAKPYAHARPTGHLARARTRTCLQAEEPPQHDKQQVIGSNQVVSGFPDGHALPMTCLSCPRLLFLTLDLLLLECLSCLLVSVGLIYLAMLF